jgi:hypothetical protein
VLAGVPLEEGDDETCKMRSAVDLDRREHEIKRRIEVFACYSPSLAATATLPLPAGPKAILLGRIGCESLTPDRASLRRAPGDAW